METKERRKHRETDEYQKLINRLNRIEGQVRGVKKMVEDERYCVDIITQVAAIRAALDSFNRQLLEAHIHTCVVEDIKNDKAESVDELCQLIGKMMK
ncbi:metal-sensing transcriptional repressor [Bariatricus massiliensis]|uniref:Metal-sensing transcriptional repressor n=1 Tax=Bariatricus massiliensis TaxID=1745713 RepID=A0ABS8DIW4_9FIRM|nr:metal-sensing transcriptional repressor [Bariatricus massiliensis]MCB7305189.1 metal-sensing transcriptional repressor [Bariatricus massiliensis]MCB7375703.1 metal-sensing transcriptional repressor [Bariatricus massiliensis]MCB7388332.1 metal-sensing transcriptional repressor [Bariatricus massiliensis]MCB7412465.1 metal-sensing transcriptional repressor [Bariatricus massiliensis]MCQ5254141.1 metal-sensing transcriptional repressor [Bariatricus massiliensis]